MSNIIRKPDFAGGGVTADEKVKMSLIAEKWINIACRTKPINKNKITSAIKKLYSVAGLKSPRVVIVPSPKVMAFAYGLASGWWWLKKNPVTDAATADATRAATADATRAATADATDAATHAATDAATYDATYAATYDATAAATYDATADATAAATYDATADATAAATYDATADATAAATYDATAAATAAATADATDAATADATADATDAATADATADATAAATYDATNAATVAATDDTGWLNQLALRFGGDEKSASFLISCISGWRRAYQGGNMWAAFPAWAEACRNVLGLNGLRCWEKHEAWEECAKEGGFRVLHEEFCIVSDFPEFIKRGIDNRPHCEDGPSHRWRDGWELFHLYGVRFEKDLYWKVVKRELSFDEIFKMSDIDKRAIAFKFCKVDEFLNKTKSKLLDGKTKMGNELWLLPKGAGIFNRDEYFLRYFCPSSGREYLEAVDPNKVKELGKCADSLMASRHGFTLKEYLDSGFVSA